MISCFRHVDIIFDKSMVTCNVKNCDIVIHGTLLMLKVMLVAILVEQHYTWERYSKQSWHWSEFSKSYPLLNILSQLLAFWSIWLSLTCIIFVYSFVYFGLNWLQIYLLVLPSLSIHPPRSGAAAACSFFSQWGCNQNV